MDGCSKLYCKSDIFLKIDIKDRKYSWCTVSPGRLVRCLAGTGKKRKRKVKGEKRKRKERKKRKGKKEKIEKKRKMDYLTF
jgi:hypothetical protein